MFTVAIYPFAWFYPGGIMKKSWKKIAAAFLLVAVALSCFVFSANARSAATYRETDIENQNYETNDTANFSLGKTGLLDSLAQLRVKTDRLSETSEIRFIAPIDSLNYDSAGFELTVNGLSRTVYVKYAYPEVVFGNGSFKASEICVGSKYFITYALTDIPQSEFYTEISVRSFVSDTDGNFVFGESVSKKVSDWFENGISLVSAPNRTVYYKDGELDVSGAKIEDIVSGDIIDVESSMISGADFSTVGEKTVTVNYLGMETRFTVSVIDKTKEFSINGIFNSHMVLQRNANTPIFGLGSDGDIVTVSFGEQTKQGTVENGKWQIALDPMIANAEPQSLVVKSSADGNTVVYDDILVGDVWLASGQSNMFLRVGDLFPYAYDKDPYGDFGIIEQQYIVMNLYDSFHEHANNPLVRSCWQWPGHENIKSNHTSQTPYDDILSRLEWVACDNSNPDLLDLQSAYAVSFALNIQKEIGVPVGVVCSSQGGTTIKEWLPIDSSSTSGIKYYMDGNNFKGNYYNSKIAPMMPFAFRGILWWQGESDALKAGYPEFSSFALDEDEDRYGEYLEKLVLTYRNGFTTCLDGKMPFIQSAIVYCNVSGNIDLRDAWKLFHDRQLAGNYTKNIEDAYTVNLWKYWVFGQADNIHPPRKWDCGVAAAEVAITNFYNN